MNEVDRTMHLRIADWKAYVLGEPVQSMLRASNREFELLEDRQRRIEEADRAWRAAPSGREIPLMQRLLNNAVAADLSTKIESLARENGYPVFGEVFITNRYGANVAQTNRTSDYRQDDEHWWRSARREGLYIGDVGFDQSANVYSTDICLRIDDAQGNFAGVLKAVLNIREVISIIDTRSRELEETGHHRLVLFTSDRRIIRIGNTITPPLDDGSTYFEDIVLTGDTPSVTLERPNPSGDDTLLSTYVTSRGHAAFKGLGWIILLEYASHDVFAPVETMRRHTLWLAIAATLLAALLGGGIALSLSTRIKRLTAATVALSRGELDARVEVRGGDEIAQLSHDFNAMATKLARVESERELMNKRLAETSRRAGMTEVATRVLHNVGNVLNSVNISVAQIRRTATKSQTAHLARVHELLWRHSSDLGRFVTEDEKGRRLPEALAEICGALGGERKRTLEELDLLSSNIAHIKTIIRYQQLHAQIGGHIEPLSLESLLQDALTLEAAALERDHIEVLRQFEEGIPDIATDRNKLLHILMNLVSNGRAALAGSASRDRKLEIRIARAGVDSLRVQVADNGVGIVPENLGRIFTPGFTTKKDGHGFGLHGSSLLAKELGGALSAHSDGGGRGATFTLELPLAPAPGVAT